MKLRSNTMPFVTESVFLGCREDGSPIWLFRGGAPEDNGGNDSGNGPDGGTGNTDDDDDSGTGEGAEGGSDDQDDDDEDESTPEGLPDNVRAILRKNRQDLKAAQKAQRAAEKAARDAQGKVQTYEDKDKGELQLAQEKLQRSEARVAELEKQVSRQSLRSAFLAVKGYNWADAEDALDFAINRFGLAEIEISDDGSVDSRKVKAVAKKLADEKPYLLEKEDNGKGGRTGGSFNGGSGKNNGKTDNAALAAKYPSMVGRRRVAG